MHRPRKATWEVPVVLCALAACAGPSRDRAPDRRPIEVLVANDAETLDPRYVTDAVGLRATRLVHAGLVRLDPVTLEPEPYVARSWAWMDPQTLRIELRTDARFHSGAPVRAHDVVETLRALASPAVRSRHASVIEAISEVEEEGPTTVIVRLGRPHATLLTDLEVPILRADQAYSAPDPSGKLDGLGPYQVESVSRGEVRLAPAADGVFPKPAHAVILRTVHDENTRALRMETGAADVALNLIPPVLLPVLSAEPGLSVTSRRGANLTYMVVNETRAPLDDVRFRQALSLSIDRPTLCASLLDGHARPATGLIAPTHWAYAAAPELAFDPVRARELFVTVPAASSRLLLYTSTERLRTDIARVIAQGLGDLGARVDVVPLDLGTLIARLNGGDFDLAILTIPEMTEPNVLRHFLHSRLVPPDGANRGHVHDAELDALLDAGDEERDPEQRRRVYARLEARARAQMHLVPLWVEDEVAVTSARASAFVPSAEGRWLGLAAIP